MRFPGKTMIAAVIIFACIHQYTSKASEYCLADTMDKNASLSPCFSDEEKEITCKVVASHEEKDYETSEKIMQKLLDEKPDDANLLMLATLLCMKQGEYDRSLEILEKYHSVIPDSLFEHHTKMLIFFSLENYESATHEALWISSRLPAPTWPPTAAAIAGMTFQGLTSSNETSVSEFQLAVEGLKCLKEYRLHQDFETSPIRLQQDCRLAAFALLETYFSKIHESPDSIRPDHSLMDLYRSPDSPGASDGSSPSPETPADDDDFELAILNEAMTDYERLVDETQAACAIPAAEEAYVKIILLRQKILLARGDHTQVDADIARLDKHAAMVRRLLREHAEQEREKRENPPPPEWSFD